ncbi:GPN-loop GTPase 3-like [Daphnia pulicaria]|uniref:GPN-loop GTPase 3-like n=1 Tax=Daphnia pulicaria TaxID=35523 RepID=UPI001EECC3B7|nr:GPN-loop GTPase 3-like [Daphnia pulicaria]
MRYAQIVIGPAGSGKSTYCTEMQRHAETARRNIHIVNLDPAAESFEYKPSIDIRDLIHVDDAMEDEEMHFGPNGALVFCMEFLLENLPWLENQLGEDDDDYFIFDCPGQIELYTHLNVMKKLLEALELWNFRLCAVFILDSHFMINSSSFISASMAALSAMTTLEVTFISILSKIDLLSKKSKKQLERFLEPDVKDICANDTVMVNSKWNQKHQMLTEMIGRVLEDYSLIKFAPLNITDEDNLANILFMVDNCMQFGEDRDIKMAEFDAPDEEDEDNDDGYEEGRG